MNREEVMFDKGNSKLQIMLCMFVTTIWVVVTHAYMFFHNAFSHDSLNAFYANPIENEWKIKLGRILKPLYQSLTRGDIALPWLIGVLIIIWTSLAVYLITKMFRLRKTTHIVLVAGVLVTNLTVSATIATYIYDADSNMLAMLMATAAAYIWYTKKSFLWYILSVICVFLSLGIYQSYISVAIVIMMIDYFVDFLHGRSFNKVLCRGIKAILILIAGALLYAIALIICKRITGISYDTGTDNSLSVMASMSFQTLTNGIRYSYEFFSEKIMEASEIAYGTVISKILHYLLISIVLIRLTPVILFSRRRVANLCAACVLLLLFPLAMNLTCVLNGGVVMHYIMIYASWLVYLLFVIVDAKGAHITNHLQRISHYLLLGLIAIIMWGNVKTSNAMYLQKEFEQQSTLSLMTRVAHDMQLTEGYVHGETPLAFIGASKAVQTTPGFKKYRKITGMDNRGYAIRSDRSLLYSYYPCEKYIHGVIGIPAKMCDDETWLQLCDDTIVEKMPCYPNDGSIQFVNGTLVVKMGEVQTD